jgi:hypothetical protein
MAVSVLWSDGQASAVRIDPAWFKPIEIISNARSFCTGIAAFGLPRGRALLWLVWDHRPQGEHVAVLLIDLRQRIVVDVMQDLGESRWSKPMILRRGSGFEVWMNRDHFWSPNDGGEFNAPDWMSVTIEGDRIVANWVR